MTADSGTLATMVTGLQATLLGVFLLAFFGTGETAAGVAILLALTGTVLVGYGVRRATTTRQDGQ